jgi:hypothetical protein
MFIPVQRKVYSLGTLGTAASWDFLQKRQEKEARPDLGEHGHAMRTVVMFKVRGMLVATGIGAMRIRVAVALSMSSL